MYILEKNLLHTCIYFVKHMYFLSFLDVQAPTPVSLWALTKRRDNIVLADMVADMVADIEEDKVADMEVNMVADINIDIDMEIQIGERVGHGGSVNWAQTFSTWCFTRLANLLSFTSLFLALVPLICGKLYSSHFPWQSGIEESVWLDLAALNQHNLPRSSMYNIRYISMLMDVK